MRFHADNVKILTNGEIIFDDFKGKESLHLANRGNTFVSLSGFLEILSKTELSSDKIDDFQEETFGRVLPKLTFEGKYFARFTCFLFSCVYTARHADGLDIQSVSVPRE